MKLGVERHDVIVLFLLREYLPLWDIHREHLLSSLEHFVLRLLHPLRTAYVHLAIDSDPLALLFDKPIITVMESEATEDCCLPADMGCLETLPST